MSISHLFPEEGPTLNLNFAGSRTLDPRITFTRTSTGTYMGPDGLIKVASTNSPRFDHRYVNGEIESLGLLVEEQRTNFCRQSEDFSTTWYNFNSSESVNSTISPDGNLTADKLIPDVGVTNGLFRQDFGINQFPDNIQMCLSVYAKAAEFSRVALSFYNNANTFCSSGGLDLSNGTFTSGPFNATRNIELIGNGWYRISIVFSSEVGNNYTNIRISSSDTGDGTSGIYIWGAQLERGAFPTSYIPTQGSTATRTADNAFITGTNFSSWYRQDEGTIFCEYNRPSAVTSLRTIVAVSDNTFTNRTNFRTDSSTNLTIFTAVNGTGQTVFNLIFNSGANTKSICAYKLNDYNAASNGIISTNDNSASVPVVDRMSIGSVLSAEPSCSYIRQISFWPQRLSNSILQTLTR